MYVQKSSLAAIFFLFSCIACTSDEALDTRQPSDVSGAESTNSGGEDQGADQQGQPTDGTTSPELGIQLRSGSNIISWQEIPDAKSYNLLVSNQPISSLDGVTVIRGVKSPYTHIKVAEGRTYYGVSVVYEGVEKFPEIFVDDQPGPKLRDCLDAADAKLLSYEAIFAAGPYRDCYTFVDGVATLTNLDLSNQGITDLSPIQDALALEQLNLAGNDLTSIEILGQFEKLTNLDLSDNPNLTSIASLAGLVELRSFAAARTQVANVDVLKDSVEMMALNLTSTPLTDLSPLQKLVKIESLVLDGVLVAKAEATCPTVTTSASLSAFCLEGVTIAYQPHIEKLNQLHCLGCHPNFNEATLTQLAAVANQMIQDGVMPKNRDPLSASDMAIFQAWVNSIPPPVEDD
ncbi:leucine-rich repeat domain-containing protein [Pseudobacteriovorax antillogorgiicola]|uniref:Leucine Rich repeat-containing protein n=1 Tax=Pseudobacteriovorax antillogorgiicola TaxID=1513793 RepID=A0A1Y6CC24_9BACT|nr:leucine-rich repeat domain-containing protein [Pseudobacteriovorax antillogorgiicola]TCS48343.1 leucine rich repeat (LRR) protein [Pseudobacteriovorax antillogorgiicola]SMF56352.1 Leucine Rich repeat-containing protein [Pseudobacteriovorax antillogorgiicola]